MENNIVEKFNRQRRNLIISSLIILFLEATGIELNTINIIGNNFKVNEPESIVLFIWVAVFYFFVRYIQVVRESNFLHFNNYYSDLFSIILRRKAFKMVKMSMFGTTSERVDGKIVIFNNIESNSFDVITKYYPWELIVSGFYKVTDGDSTTQLSFKQTVHISKFQIFVLNVRSFFSMCISTTYFTEYLLPFFILLIPIMLTWNMF